ncbi:MAG: hypothetical protein RIT02_1685, partial [Planctomycetota bacterium]
PEAVPEFTANAFADHHRRIRLASNSEPKTMNSLRGRGGMPSTTPHIMGNDTAKAEATVCCPGEGGVRGCGWFLWLQVAEQFGGVVAGDERLQGDWQLRFLQFQAGGLGYKYGGIAAVMDAVSG